MISSERRRTVLARAGAFAMDTLLVAYALWCVSLLDAHAAEGIPKRTWLLSAQGFLGERPWLLLLAPLVAVLWEATGRSLGQLGYRIRIEEADPPGVPASRDRHAYRALVAAAVAVVPLVPLGIAVLGWKQGRDGTLHLALALLAICALLAAGFFDPWGRGLVDRLAGTVSGKRPAETTIRHRPWYRRLTPWIVLVLLGLTFAVGFLIAEVKPAKLVTGVGDTGAMWGRLVRPDWSITGSVIEKLVETVFLALMASALALPFAFGLSFLGARNITGETPWGRVVYGATRVFMNVTRSIEPLVWALIFTIWVGVGPFAGMMALLVHSVAALGKLYSEAIESIDPGPVEAIRATGANALQTVRYGVVPQVIPPFLSFTIYRWDINVRMATILGLVGGGGIGDMLIVAQQLGAWSKVGTMILFITLVVWLMDWASSKARQRIM